MKLILIKNGFFSMSVASLVRAPIRNELAGLNENMASFQEMCSALSMGEGKPCPFPPGVAQLTALYALQRFEPIVFGPQLWKDHYGCVPVTLPSIESLRQRITQKWSEIPVSIEKMSAAECANYLREVGEEEQPEPSPEMFVALNSRIRPNQPLAGFTCAVTYIPQFVRRNNQVLAVTSRTLAVELGPNPLKGDPIELYSQDCVFRETFKPEDADGTEPSQYFVMQLDLDPETRGKMPSVLMAECQELGWPLPDPRNFMATIFSRCAWKSQLLLDGSHTYSSKLTSEGLFMGFGVTVDPGQSFFGVGPSYGITVFDSIDTPFVNKGNSSDYGAACARKFEPLTRI